MCVVRRVPAHPTVAQSDSAMQYSLVDEKKQPVQDSAPLAMGGTAPGGPAGTGVRSPNASISSDGSGGSGGGGSASPKANGHSNGVGSPVAAAADDANPLHRLAADGANDDLFIKAMTENATRLNSVDKFGYSPLMLAAEHNRSNVVSLLLRKLPAGECDGPRHPQTGRTALGMAVAAGHADVIRRFVDDGLSADFTIEDKSGKRPIDLIPAGRDDIKTLLQDGIEKKKKMSAGECRTCEGGCVIA